MKKMFRLIKKETSKLVHLFLHPTFIYLTVIGNSILIAATLAVYFLEKGVNPLIHNYFDSLWWGIATITTVAYGDIVPSTIPGRIIGICLMYTGTVLFITFTGLVFTVLLAPLTREMAEEEAETKKIEKSISELKGKIEELEKRI